jgi:hypothetical protein
MTRFILLAVLIFSAVVIANAQRDPRGTSTVDTVQDALRDPDPIHRDERLIAGANRNIRRIPREDPLPPSRSLRSATPLPVFKARVVVTNHSAKLIKSVYWTAILTQPGTNDIISQHHLTSHVDIAPGKTKKVTQKLQIRPVRVVNVAKLPPVNSPQVADLKVAVTEVIYADGSTSKTP